MAGICIDGKTICLGSFSEIEDAAAARKKADIKYGFHKNHGRELNAKADKSSPAVF